MRMPLNLMLAIAKAALNAAGVGLFQKKGPVIVRPALNLCQALLDTEIRLPTSEFRMPYPIMGIELPEAIVKPHWPSLTRVWKMFPDTVLASTMSPNPICYHNLIGANSPTYRRPTDQGRRMRRGHAGRAR